MKKRNKQNAFATIFSAMLATVVAIALVSCDNDLDVQQGYPFTVETMPVPKRIVKGETVEIRCELKREGRFSDARYTVRYFQPDGKGSLRMDDGMVLLPNDRYPLDREVFRLYYTSECEDQQSIDIYFEDNSAPAQLFLLSFDFNNEKKDDAEDLAYWVGTAIFLFVQIYYTSSGSVRWYFVLGIGLGASAMSVFLVAVRKWYRKIVCPGSGFLAETLEKGRKKR